MSDRSETIAAYFDGAMSEAEMLDFEEAMARDPALANEVAQFGANDALLREAFDAPMQAGVDQALLERMGLAERNSAHQPNATPTAAPVAANDNPPFLQRWRWPIGGAIAASLALIALLQTGQQPAGRDGFAVALDETPSSVAAKLADGRTITPRLTFAARDGRYCREYLVTADGRSETGIACRSKGDWAVEALAAGGEALPGQDQIVSAAGAETAKLDAAYARLGASDPLDAASEGRLIAGKWSLSGEAGE